MQPLKKIDEFLNGITMYRLLLYGLTLLAAIGIVFAFAGVLPLKPGAMLVSLSVLSVISFGANLLFGRLYNAPVNNESSLISALILFFILSPPKDFAHVLAIGLTAIIAMASKYVVAVRHKHIFNPAAFGAVMIGLVGLQHASWWVASDVLLPFTLILGLLVVRKIRRFDLFVSFLVAALVMLLAMGLKNGQAASEVLKQAFVSWPVIFFGTIMLTEPLTSPPTHNKRVIYGVLAGLIFGSQLSWGSLATTPAMSLVLANIFAFAVSQKYRVNMVLQSKKQLGPNLYDFVFKPNLPLKFQAGQYMEWTLPYVRLDGRGNRRTFTIASSPTEPLVHLGVKFYEPSSSFKQTLRELKVGDHIAGGQIAGDFLLPADKTKTLVFIAGGIGITPFRSIVKQMIDKHETRDITLFYIVNNPDELVYKDVFTEAEELGVKLKTISPKVGQTDSGRLTPGDFKKVPEFKERLYYISGPQGMVKAYEQMLKQTGVSTQNIITDYFPGY